MGRRNSRVMHKLVFFLCGCLNVAVWRLIMQQSNFCISTFDGI